MKTALQRGLVAAVLIGAGVVAGIAVADGVPTTSPLTYGGTVTDTAGKPYATAVDVSVAFFDQAAGGTQQCGSQKAKAEAGTGRFTVVLPADCAKAVHDHADLWVETTVGPASSKLPRTRVGAVPFALVADVASHPSGALKTQIDGLIKDIAALKAAGSSGGGGSTLKVYDGTGQVLGTFAGYGHDGNNPTSLSALTSKGYLVLFNSTATYAADQIDFQTQDCTWGPLISHPAYLGTGQRVAVTNKAGQLKFFVAETGKDAKLKPATLARAARLDPSSGLCKPSSGATTATAIALKEITAAEAGLPATITAPIIVK